MQEIDLESKAQEQILSYLEKESFFDIESQQYLQQKLFKKVQIDLKDIIIKDKVPLTKKSEKNGTLNLKTIYFSENFLFYETNEKNIVKQLNYSNSRVFFAKNQNKTTIFFEICIIKNQKKCEFFTEDETIYGNLKRFLSLKLVLTDFHSDFDLKKMIGKGSFAKVYMATNKEDNKEYAVKVFIKELLVGQCYGKVSVVNEISIMRKLNNPHLLKVYQVYETDHSIYVVMDLINGGELLNRVKETKDFSQKDLAKIMFFLLQALKDLHSKGIMHRDIKPENILVKNLQDFHDIVIVDFGLSTFIENNASEVFFKRCGTPGFVAPEILNYNENQKKFYNEKCDVFSAGIIFYILLTGEKPFPGRDFNEIMKKNKNCSFDFAAPYFKDKPSSAIDLIKKMVFFLPDARISAAQALNHKYFQEFLDEDLLNLIWPIGEEKKISQEQEKINENNKNFKKEENKETINVPFFMNKAILNGKTDTLEKIENNYNSAATLNQAFPQQHNFTQVPLLDIKTENPSMDLQKQIYENDLKAKTNSYIPQKHVYNRFSGISYTRSKFRNEPSSQN